MVHVFCEQGLAAGLERRGHNQSIEESQLVASRKTERRLFGGLDPDDMNAKPATLVTAMLPRYVKLPKEPSAL